MLRALPSICSKREVGQSRNMEYLFRLFNFFVEGESWCGTHPFSKIKFSNVIFLSKCEGKLEEAKRYLGCRGSTVSEIEADCGFECRHAVCDKPIVVTVG